MATKSIGKSKVSEAIAKTKAAFLKKYNVNFINVDVVLAAVGLDEHASIEELFTFDDTPAGVRAVMGTVAARYAYYANIKTVLDTALGQVQGEYESWNDNKYLAVCATHEKGTETFKNAQVRVTYARDYNEWQAKIQSYTAAIGRVKVILTSLDILKDMISGINANIRQEQEMFNRMNGAGA